MKLVDRRRRVGMTAESAPFAGPYLAVIRKQSETMSIEEGDMRLAGIRGMKTA